MQVANHLAKYSVEFAFYALALLAAAARRMLKTRVTLGNIPRVLLNLIKSLIFVMFSLNFCFLALSVSISVMICNCNCEEFFYGMFEDCNGLCNSHYSSSYFRIFTR